MECPNSGGYFPIPYNTLMSILTDSSYTIMNTISEDIHKMFTCPIVLQLQQLLTKCPDCFWEIRMVTVLIQWYSKSEEEKGI